MSRKNKNHQKLKNRHSNPSNTSATMNQQKLQAIPKASFTAIVKMLSDWHIGCGAGRTGDIDSLVQRDLEGLPYIPAKTLTGIWRDACEIVALSLDNQQETNWQQWVDYLFGDQPAERNRPTLKTIEFPRPAALSIRAAYLPKNLRALLKDKPQLKEALTFVKPGIQIEPESGCAKEDFLRFEEMVRGGTILEAECELNLPENDAQQCAAYALLIAGTQLVERLGGKRRRGAGKCQLVVEPEIKYWIEWLVANPIPPAVPDLEKELDNANIEDISITKTDNDHWLCIPLNITAKSPVIISKRTVGNITETLDYIPGTHLLPLISRKLSHLGVNLGNAIAYGDLLVTNATLEVGQQQGRPIPLALFYEKLGGGIEKGGTVYNRFLESEPNGKQLKGYRTGYIGPTNNSHLPEYAKVNLTVGTHNTIEDEYQRPTSDVGGVYSYQAIQAGTKLKAELRLRVSIANLLSQKKQNWWNCLKVKERIGQSKKDDYGAVSIEIEQPLKYRNKLQNIDSTLTVWLLSDVLLRDERLRPSTSLKDLAKELGELLKVELTIQQEGETLSLIARQQRIESWQVSWRLPRPSLVGLAAGTCVVFTVNGQIDPAKLTEIEASGIGERRAEGYGQICFNDPLLLTKTSNLQNNQVNNHHSQNHPSQQLIQPNTPTFTYARIVEKAAWREAIRRSVLEVAANSNKRFGIKKDKPTMSQLGALRSILRQLQQPEDDKNPGVVIQWLKNLEDTPNRRDKWLSESLQEIRLLISDKNEIWNILKINLGEITLTSTGKNELKGEQWNQSEQLWTEAVQILVDACIRTHKRDLENNSNSNVNIGS